MYNYTVGECTLFGIIFLLSTLNLVMCMVAIAATLFYKFYRSFNYRLILYQLISFLIKELITMTQYTLMLLLDIHSSYFDIIMIII